jgi:uncharacterized delta-60 repeat protein
LALALSAVLLLLAAGSAEAAPGVLDPAFGAGTGIVTTSIGMSAGADAVVVQPDGKIVAAGGVAQANNSEDFALARYEADGTLDPTFGSGGIVEGPAGTAIAVALQADGKIVAAGTVSNQISVARYNADGSLDPAFGSGGVVTTAASGFGSEAKALVLQPDGKIVIGGDSSNGFQTQFTLVRYDANGSLDATFGTGGVVTTQVGAASSSIDGLALQPDGKIVAGGDAVKNSLAVPGLARYNADGSLDSTFGSGGIVTTPVVAGQSVSGGPLALQPDGKIVAVATSGSFWLLTRYQSDGSLDPSFPNGGFGFGGGSPPGPSSLILQPDGKIVVAGVGVIATTTPTSMTSYHLTVVRWNPDGMLDQTISSDGAATIDAGTAQPGTPPPARAAIALQPDGKIVAAGTDSADGGTSRQFLLARLGASTVSVVFGDYSMSLGGEISSSPDGIDCTVDALFCGLPVYDWRHAFAAGPVTLTATPNAGWYFAGWSGDGCSGTGTCVVHMSGAVSDDQQVTPDFELDPAKLVVKKTGSGTGSVTSSPAGIDCGSACMHSFANRTWVNLTAHPSGHSRFSGWSGGVCNGSRARTCRVLMFEDRVATAHFQGFCIVPSVKGQTLRAARGHIRKAHCGIGAISRRYSKVTRGRVVSQRPRAKRRIRSGAKVDLVVSKGRRPLP